MNFHEIANLAGQFGFTLTVQGTAVHVCPINDPKVSRWATSEANLMSYTEAALRKEFAILASLETGDVAGAVDLAHEETEETEG